MKYTRLRTALVFAFVSVVGLASACGPSVARTPANMRDVAWYHLAPEGYPFEIDVPTEPNSRSSRDRLDGFDEPIVTTEWQIRTDDRSALFSVSHVRYPSGFLRDARIVQRVLDWAPRYVVESMPGARLVSRSNVRGSGGARGIKFTVRAEDRSTLDGRFLIRGDEGVLAVAGVTSDSRWRGAADRMMRSLRLH